VVPRRWFLTALAAQACGEAGDAPAIDPTASTTSLDSATSPSEPTTTPPSETTEAGPDPDPDSTTASPLDPGSSSTLADPSSTDGGDTTTGPAPLEGFFVEVTAAVGIDTIHEIGGPATGQAWGDVDRDGDLDLFLTGGLGSNALWTNAGDGTFTATPLAADAAMDGIAKGGATWADYDNDGWLDLYVAALGPNVLLHNEAGRALQAVDAGVADEGHGRAAAWGDYDGDGWLDLYVVNASMHPDRLYRGSPGGTFTDVSDLVALPEGKPGFAAVWVDYDEDDDVDLYVANDHLTGNDLWRNDGGTFTNVSEESGAGIAVYGMGIAVGDYDGDGDLDLFVTDIDRTNLLRNELVETGEPVFTEVAEAAGVSHPSVSWGAVWLDYDHDGWQDLYFATLHAGPPELTNRLYRNLGDGTFEDVSAVCGCADPGWSWGVAAGDYDGDGAVDLVIGNRNAPYRLYRNEDGPIAGSHFVAVELDGGTVINRDAIGARVTVHTSDGRLLVRDRRSGSSLGSGDMLTLHFGLGAAVVDAVEIRWPDGLVETFTDVPTDTTWSAARR
jgi:hypothetical protein